MRLAEDHVDNFQMREIEL